MGVPVSDMLRFLGVRHLAVIDRLEVEFEPGLNLLTGETGAGKSVLVEAIDLLVGGRASADLVRTGESTAIVQAVFERSDGREVIIRREISSEGRSRAFIDDALATSGALRELGRELVDLHGQHEHQTLLDPAAHLAHLDVFLAEPALIADVAAVFDVWRAAAVALDRSRLDDREKRARIEMASFQLQEIDRVAPADEEDDRLMAERAVLANADRLTRLSADAYRALYDGDDAALPALSIVWKRVGELAEIDSRFVRYVEERDAVKASLEDLALFLRAYTEDIDASPVRLQAVEDRLAALERLKRKYGPTLADVIAKRRALADDLALLGSSEEQAAALGERERETRGLFLSQARTLSAARRQAATTFAATLARALAELAMPHAVVDVRVAASDLPEAWTQGGIDAVEFFLSANPGEEPRPLRRIASGGELSRVMLALRTLVDESDAAHRTLVFDEVDAGIGGAAADAVGTRLQVLGRRQQVICITHLAQIAARAASHFRISKEIRGGRTVTLATRLDPTGRELEIARMIAGAEVSPEVILSARQMLAVRGESEIKAKTKAGVAAKAKGKASAR